jgi:hypothetical protein
MYRPRPHEFIPPPHLHVITCCQLGVTHSLNTVMAFKFWLMLWGSIKIASRVGRNVMTSGERVSHFALSIQGIPTKGVHGVTFKGSTIDERCDWQWIPTTNQNVNDSMSNSYLASHTQPDSAFNPPHTVLPKPR